MLNNMFSEGDINKDNKISFLEFQTIILALYDQLGTQKASPKPPG